MNNIFHYMRALLFGSLWMLATVFLTSCNKDAQADPLIDIPPTFQIAMKEVLQADEENRALEIHLASVELLDCQNYRIDYSFVKYGRHLDLTLKDFALAAPCLPGETIARDSFSIGVMKTKDFSLTISLKDVIHNEGALKVTPASYIIDLETTYGILKRPEVLYRIPSLTIWGDVHASTPQADSLAGVFLEELRQAASAADLHTGYYGHFRIDEAGVVQLEGLKVQAGAESFAWSYSGGRNELYDLVSAFRSAGGEDLSIRLYGSDGAVY